MYRLIGTVSYPVVHGLFRLEARGLERLPQGGFVLAANHLSNFDPWPLGMPLLPQRWVRFMAKSELYWWPLSAVARRGRRVQGPARRRRHRGDRRPAVELVRNGEIVVMFPEGTRRKKGHAQDAAGARPHRRRAHRATRRRAARSGRDQGNRPARRGSRSSRSSYGEPFEPGEDAQAATERLMNEIEELYDRIAANGCDSRCSPSTATRSRIARTTRCRSRSTATRSSASRTC